MRSGEEPLWAPGSGAIVTGWGRTENAGSTDVLRQAPIAIAPDSLCLQSYAGFALTFDPAVMLCTGLPAGGPAECNGDSGGPLVVSDGRGAVVQAGVVSWSRKDALIRCGTAGDPGVYAHLGAFVPGLSAFMRGHPSAPIGDPAALTGAAAGVSATGAVLGGNGTPDGLATHARVEYGTTRAYGASVYVGGGSAPVPVGIPVGGLAPGTLHHFRVVAEGTAGVSLGADQTFTTAGAPRPRPACGGPRRAPPAAGVTRRGTPRRDRLVGTNGPDRLFGLGGPDLLIGRGGADLLVGGPGTTCSSGAPGTIA